MSAALPLLRLYTSNGSPFCLKVMVLMRELGIKSVELDYSVTAFPTAPTTTHSHLAPLGKIPALEIISARARSATEHLDGSPSSTVLFGSQVICQYLASIAPSNRKVLPAEGTLERFEALTTEALADGMCEAALSLRYERLERPSALLWQEWVDGQLSKIKRAIPVLAKRRLPDPTSDVFPLDGIAAAISLYYVDRRAADSKWRDLEGGGTLDAWYRQVQQRASWQETPFVK
ncbi:hypothetical protein JCM10212_002473 [Sporobolomyces blumeae]